MLSRKAKDAWKEGGSKWKACSSRLIVATLAMGRHQNDRLHVLSCYAPTYGASQEEKEQFYVDLQQALAAIPPRECYVVLGDFNARVGSREADQHKTGFSTLFHLNFIHSLTLIHSHPVHPPIFI